MMSVRLALATFCALSAHSKSWLPKDNVPVAVLILLRLMSITQILFWHEILYNLRLLLNKKSFVLISVFFLNSGKTKLREKRTECLFTVISSSRGHYKIRKNKNAKLAYFTLHFPSTIASSK